MVRELPTACCSAQTLGDKISEMTRFKGRLKLPKKKTEWIVACCWFMYIITEIIVRAFLPSGIDSAAQIIPFHTWFFRFLRNLSLAGGISSSIIFGIRSVRQKGYGKRRLIVPLFGISFSFFIICFSIFNYLKISAIQQNTFEVEKMHLNSLETILRYEDLSPSDRSKTSRRYAQWLFIYLGETVNYVTLEDRKKLYEPTDKDKQMRDEKILTKTLFDRAIKDNQKSFFIWLILTFLSISFGLFFPVHNNNLTKIT